MAIHSHRCSKNRRRWPSRAVRTFRHRSLAIQFLEARRLLSGDTLSTATPLSFTLAHTAHTAHFLATPNEVDLYQLGLGAGAVVKATVSAQTSGSGLLSVVRVFDTTGRPVALDDQEGGDPQLTFQARTAGNYYIGISSAGDDAYDPNTSVSGHGGATTGLFSLDLRLTPGASPTADLAGSSFRLGKQAAAWGETVPVTFMVDNRGGADASGFKIQVLLSSNQLFDATSPVLQTISVPGLPWGQSYSSANIMVTLPGLATAQAAGLPTSGPVYFGLRIDPESVVPELNPFEQSGVHRGEDWEALTIVTPVTASGHNQSLGTADVLSDSNNRVSDTLTAGQTDWYQLTVSDTERLTAALSATGGSTVVPRLALYSSGGNLLIQSDNGSLVQYLEPGPNDAPQTYYLAVSARSGTGSYQLISELVQTNVPLGGPLVGDNQRSVAVADVNGDGNFDLITSNHLFTYPSSGDSVSVLLGNSDGTFRTRQTFDVGEEPYSVTLADVNGDGRPDLVTANRAENTVSVLLGTGDGTLQPQQKLDVGSGPISVALADVNGDGTTDLVVANGYDNTVSVLRGNGDGSFKSQQTFAVGLQPYSVAAADVNGDGCPDLVVANGGRYNDPGNTVSVLLGSGDGSFQPQQTFAVGTDPEFVAVADINGDGQPDLVVANTTDGTVSVLVGNDNSSLFDTQQIFAVGSGPQSLAVADVNGDGQPDLIVANRSDTTISVLLGSRDSSLFQIQHIFPLDSDPLSVAVGDMNGDGRPDLVFAVNNRNTGSVLLGNGDGSFQSPKNSGFKGIGSVADVNGDGRPDLILVGIYDSAVVVQLGNGDGTFKSEQSFAVGLDPESIQVADVNGDGRPDLVVANRNNQYDPYSTVTISVLLGNGDGTFQPEQTFAAGTDTASVRVAKLEGDNKPEDLIVPNRKDGTISVALGNGDGTFQPQHTFELGGSPSSLSVAEVNGDGWPDLVVTKNVYGLDTGEMPGTVSVLLGNGDGTFRTGQSIAVGKDPDFVTVADMNGDGLPDLVVANLFDDTASVLLGNGDGTFQSQQTFFFGSDNGFTAGLGDLAVADVNGDGRPDLIAQYRFKVDVLLGDGQGTSFDLKQAVVIASNVGSLSVADVNGDGAPDLVTTGFYDTGGSALLNNGDLSFTTISPSDGVGLRNTPQVANLTGHRGGTLDTVVLNTSGQIEFRRGLGHNQFASPIPLNDKKHLGVDRPARDITAVKTARGLAIAAADARFDPTMSSTGNFE
jgi:hypothetical protein